MSETKILAIPTHIAASTDKDGRKRPAHIATRHRAVPVTESATPGENATALDGWIAKHGGAEHLRKTLDDMTADQRAKLLDAMAHVDGITAADVMKKLGIHEPQASEEQAEIDQALEQFRTRLTTAKDEGVITSDEYDLITGICENEGLDEAIAALGQLRAPAPGAEVPPVEAAIPMTTAAVAEAAEGAAGVRPALEAQAAEMYQQHVTSANLAHRSDFEIEKRGIRGWKIPQAMRDEAQRHHDDAAKYLAAWTAFVQANGLGPGLS